MNGGISRKSYLLFGRYKDDWDIGTYLKPHFEKKNILNNFEILRPFIPYLSRKRSLRALQFRICKFEAQLVNKLTAPKKSLSFTFSWAQISITAGFLLF